MWGLCEWVSVCEVCDCVWVCEWMLVCVECMCMCEICEWVLVCVNECEYVSV